MDLCKLTALELGELLRAGGCTREEALNAARADNLNAFIAVTRPSVPAGNHSPLAGVPMAYKDNICTKGLPTTCASKMLADFMSPYDATVVERLSWAGAVSLGKLNMDEFAMGGNGETSYFGPTRNPWDTRRTPGGSSSGSAAAVAAGQVWYTLGSDTGGSVRQPASYCGVTGFKPSYGGVSRYGLIAHASSLDQLGPIARSAADCAALLSIMGGKDPRDATSLDLPPAPPLDGDLRGKKVGILTECFAEGLDCQVAAAVEETAAVLRCRGAVVERCSLPALRYAVGIYSVLSPVEASSNLARFDGLRYGFHAEGCETSEELRRTSRTRGFGPEVQRRILLGTYLLSSEDEGEYYQKAQKARALLRQGYDELFARYDLLLTPTTPTTAPLLGGNSDPVAARLSDLYTIPVNLAGLPALSMPCGFDRLGLPMGAQLIGRRLGDWTILNAAHGYQLDTDWHRAVPWERGIS